jgi:hypothetical protein
MAKSSVSKEYEKIFGESFVPEDSISSVPKKSSNPILNFITGMFSIIVGPNRKMTLEWSENGYKSIGLLMMIAHVMIFVFFNSVMDFVDYLDWGKSMTVGIKAFIVVYAIYQVFRGMLIFNGQGYLFDKHEHHKDVLFWKAGGRYGPRNVDMGTPRFGSFSNDNEIRSTVSYMNSKMSGMSNSTKEKYLRDFHGGSK